MTRSSLDTVETEPPRVRLENEPRQGWLSRTMSRSTPKVIEADEIDGPVDSTHGTTAAGRKPPWLFISFLVMVILPFLSALAYFSVFASDQYIAEARFAVRSLADDGSAENTDMSLMNMQAASQDAYVITSFIHSTEILRRLDGKVDYRSMFTDRQADYFSRFEETASDEEFLKYWESRISAYIDGPSGIVTLSARTFRPEDSVELLTAILRESEILVNEMTQRAREDMVGSFRQEVKRTGELYQSALANLNRFRQESGLLSPEMQAQETGKLLTGLLAQKMELESRLFVIQQSNGSNAPAFKQMQLARESLDQQIESLRGEMTGGEDSSLANVINNYSRVETDRLVTEKLYEAARNAYDLALNAAMRKALYLTVFVQPSLPQESLYPKRISSPLMIFLVLLASWTTLALIWASVEDHRL